MADAYINRIATAVPDHDVHRKFVDYAPSLLSDDRYKALFRRMADRSDIEHRYSFINPHPDADQIDVDQFYQPGAFPNTAERMRFYERHALG
nr:type III polyketide synthase [Pseudomonadota bacterium]